MGDARIPDLNTVVIAGRLTRDPELKYIQSGKAMCSISIACSRYDKDKSGEKKEDTSFIDATCWDKTAEWVAQLKKGRPVVIEGRLKSESWEDKTTGQKRSKLLIMANRVQPLDWEDKGSSQATETAATNYDGPESDIPF